MNRFLRILFLILLALPSVASADDSRGASLQLVLAPELYAVQGVPMSIYFDNAVLTQSPGDFRFEVNCDIGQTHKRHWSTTPTNEEVGKHRLVLEVSTADGNPLARAVTTLHVIPASAGADREKIRLLIIGDSLTHATLYPNELARLLTQPANPKWRMFGTHKPKLAASGVAHEGYGGWTWQRFVSKYEPNPDGTYRKRSSPFVYLTGDKPRLDVKRYLEEECGGEQPDFVIFLLGINDCFSAAADKPDARIDAMFKQADILLAAFREAAPNARLGVCLTTPPNSREAAFEANYKGRYSRWGWKRIQHRLVHRQIEHFSSQKRANLSLIPTHLNLDPINGYPANNGVHPNQAGYQQIGATMYAWLKSELASEKRQSD